ncbi:hypothetical protein F5144DRAFT_480247, partial [Chaetomium tenue]
GAQTAALGRPDWVRAGAIMVRAWSSLMWDDARYAWSPLGEDCRGGSVGDGPDRVDTGGKVLRGGPSPSESANGGSRGGAAISLLQNNKTMNPSPPP